MKEKVTLVVSLFIHARREADFEQFESAAAAIMRRHGGAIERRVGFAAHAVPGQPHEVHIVTFPDRRSFEQYRGDADLLALADLRARAIRDTIVWTGEDLPNFKPPAS